MSVSLPIHETGPPVDDVRHRRLGRAPHERVRHGAVACRLRLEQGRQVEQVVRELGGPRFAAGVVAGETQAVGGQAVEPVAVGAEGTVVALDGVRGAGQPLRARAGDQPEAPS